jgi:hypothetical protein
VGATDLAAYHGYEHLRSFRRTPETNE